MSNSNPSPETRFKPGQSGNPLGRPKGGLKDYDRKKFIAMTDEEKEEYLAKISPEMRYRMAEGNPHQTQDNKVEGTLVIEIAKEIAKKNDVSPFGTESNS